MFNFCITFEFKHAWSGTLSFGQFWTWASFDLRTHQSWTTTKLFDRWPPHYQKPCSVDDAQIPRLCSLFDFRQGTRRDASIINLASLSQVFFFFPPAYSELVAVTDPSSCLWEGSVLCPPRSIWYITDVSVLCTSTLYREVLPYFPSLSFSV